MKIRLSQLLLLVLLAGMQLPLAQAEDWVYTTRPGDTLWDISKRFLKSERHWPRILKYNNIKDPKHLPPGKKIRIPYEWLQQKAANALLLSYSGHVSVWNHAARAVALKPDLALGLGFVVETGTQSSAIIRFADKSSLYVRENTRIRLDSISYNANTAMVDTRVRLETGRVESRVIPFRRSGNRFEIKTPTAVAAVRGTTFRVDFGPDHVMLSEVVEGSIKVKNDLGEQVVTKGFGTIVEPGKPPLPPETLLPAVDLSRVANVYLNKSIRLRWPNLDKASAYRAMILSGGVPPRVLLDRTVKVASFHWRAATDGRFVLQVRAIAKSGLQGLPASKAFSVGLETTNNLPPPKLYTPFDGARLLTAIPTLHWFSVKNALDYRVQVSRTQDFAQPLYDEIVSAQFFSLPSELKTGTYYWRVAAVSGELRMGSFSEAFRFHVP